MAPRAKSDSPQWYVATRPLFIEGEGMWPSRAHNPGDVVEAEAVERFGWEDGVEPHDPGKHVAVPSFNPAQSPVLDHPRWQQPPGQQAPEPPAENTGTAGAKE